MRVLLWLMTVVLLGCPEWEVERVRRCQALDASTGVCAPPDAGRPDAGTPDAGSVDSGVRDGGVADGGAIDAGGGDAGEPTVDLDRMAIAQPSAALTHSFGSDVRAPVLLWEAPIPGPPTLATVEISAGATTVWRSGSQGYGRSPHDWCASAVNDQFTVVGAASIDGVSVDDMDAGDFVATNRNYPLTGCPEALAAYQRGDGGLAFLGIFNEAQGLRLERTSPDAGFGPELSFLVDLPAPRVGEATTDRLQRTWISAATPDGLVAVEVARDGLAGGAHLLSLSDAGARVDLSSSGTSVHAAWTVNDRLWLATMVDGGIPQLQNWKLSGPVRLVDLVENPDSVVVLLEYPVVNGAAMLIHDAVGDSFFRIETPDTFWFRPGAAHLRTSLRIAGQCLMADGGPGGDNSAGCLAGSLGNPLVTFSFKPDGGAW